MPETSWPLQFDQLLREQLPLMTVGEEIPDDRSLFELGLDSLGAVTLLSGIEDSFRVMFADEILDAELFSSAAYLWQVVEKLRN